MATSQRSHDERRLTSVPSPPPNDEHAEALAAWRAVADGYDRAIAILSPEHPEHDGMVRSMRHVSFLARRPMLRGLEE